MCQEMHRVSLHWLCGQNQFLTSNISVKYVHSNQQIADILTKGSFACDRRNELMMILFDSVSEPFFSIHCSPFSVVAALAPLAHELAKREKRHSLDEASKFEGTSATSIPEGKRAFALVAVRHQKSSPLFSAQEETQTNVKCQENSTPGASTWNEDFWIPNREQQRASSSSRRNESQNPRAQASGDRLQSTLKDDGDMRNLLSPGVELIPNMLTKVNGNYLKTFGNFDFTNFPIMTQHHGVSSHVISCGHHSKRAGSLRDTPDVARNFLHKHAGYHEHSGGGSLLEQRAIRRTSRCATKHYFQMSV